MAILRARARLHRRRLGRTVARIFEALAAMLADAEDELGRIDAIAGDGDHGRGMVKGSAAARAAAAEAVEQGAGQGSVLAAAGRDWAAKAGGTSGVLWGALLSALGTRLGDHRSAGLGDGRRGDAGRLRRVGPTGRCRTR